jgi:hypothetical protein
VAIVSFGSSNSFAKESKVAAGCQSGPIKACLRQLSAVVGHDVSLDAESRNWCTKHLTPCAIPALPASVYAAPPAHGTPIDTPQTVFLRADHLDNPFPGLTQSAPAGQAVGASFGYTHNGFVQSSVKTGSKTTTVVSQSDSVNFTGLSTYLLAQRMDAVPSGDVEWLPALWIYGNGNWDHPAKAFGDTSALQVGPKAEFLFHPINGSPWSSYVDVAPFFQTDFYGDAEAGGGSVRWMPLNKNLFLGGVPDGFQSTYLTGFMELIAEAENLNVVRPGQTNLTQHDYQWFGGAARLYLFPFPKDADPNDPLAKSDPLANRILFVATVQSYWDANSGISATLASASLQYKLSCDTKTQTVCPYGSPSIALSYGYGTDKDFLQRQNLVKLTINYAY